MSDEGSRHNCVPIDLKGIGIAAAQMFRRSGQKNSITRSDDGAAAARGDLQEVRREALALTALLGMPHTTARLSAGALLAAATSSSPRVMDNRFAPHKSFAQCEAAGFGGALSAPGGAARSSAAAQPGGEGALLVVTPDEDQALSLLRCPTKQADFSVAHCASASGSAETLDAVLAVVCAAQHADGHPGCRGPQGALEEAVTSGGPGGLTLGHAAAACLAAGGSGGAARLILSTGPGVVAWFTAAAGDGTVAAMVAARERSGAGAALNAHAAKALRAGWRLAVLALAEALAARRAAQGSGAGDSFATALAAQDQLLEYAAAAEATRILRAEAAASDIGEADSSPPSAGECNNNRRPPEEDAPLPQQQPAAADDAAASAGYAAATWRHQEGELCIALAADVAISLLVRCGAVQCITDHRQQSTARPTRMYRQPASSPPCLRAVQLLRQSEASSIGGLLRSVGYYRLISSLPLLAESQPLCHCSQDRLLSGADYYNDLEEEPMMMPFVIHRLLPYAFGPGVSEAVRFGSFRMP